MQSGDQCLYSLCIMQSGDQCRYSLCIMQSGDWCQNKMPDGQDRDWVSVHWAYLLPGKKKAVPICYLMQVHTGHSYNPWTAGAQVWLQLTLFSIAIVYQLFRARMRILKLVHPVDIFLSAFPLTSSGPAAFRSSCRVIFNKLLCSVSERGRFSVCGCQQGFLGTNKSENFTADTVFCAQFMGCAALFKTFCFKGTFWCVGHLLSFQIPFHTSALHSSILMGKLSFLLVDTLPSLVMRSCYFFSEAGWTLFCHQASFGW